MTMYYAALFLLLLPWTSAAPWPVVTTDHEYVTTGNYIVKFKDGSSISTMDSILGILSDEEKPLHIYNEVFRGFSGKLHNTTLYHLQGHPEIDFVEPDKLMKAFSVISQTNAQWGLGRISNRKPGGRVYKFDDSAGQGTCTYVIDTGVMANHRDFNGRARQLANFIPNEPNVDNNGHGTHVAGTVGGNTFGVAKKTTIIGVKVLAANNFGPTSGIVAGMDWVLRHAPTANCPRGVVVNLSLGGSYSGAMNTAADRLVSVGYFVAVAAGNARVDARGISPASARSVCTVGATEPDDTMAAYSNYGPLVNILAPGSRVVSAWRDGGAYEESGTSMATPHVAGIAAYMMSRRGKHPGGGTGLCSFMVQMSSKNAVRNVFGGTYNYLAYNGVDNETASDNWFTGEDLSSEL
ncbi:alkaline serine protease P32 [Xylariaceae sp. AK1471]|nr:alkaline serine protease P32 [Xylariaceae sp. AK1471]